MERYIEAINNVLTGWGIKENKAAEWDRGYYLGMISMVEHLALTDPRISEDQFKEISKATWAAHCRIIDGRFEDEEKRI